MLPGSPRNRGAPAPIPDKIKRVMDMIIRDFPECDINQCTVNRFSRSSHLPEHSDNERTIKPESNIFTVSVGVSRNVIFKDTISGTEKVVPIAGRSIYAMSQPSQCFWTHRINHDDDTDEGLRYSMTFRSVSAHNKNSTILLGDSNTKYHFLEGDKAVKGKSTFGAEMPGKRVPTFHISQIDPLCCLGYKNIILHVGVNDFNPRSKGRLDTDPDAGDVRAHFANFAGKIKSIQALCPHAKLVVSPILPTKLKIYNDRAKRFNSMLFQYMQSQPEIKVLNFNSFLGRSDSLDNELGSYLNPQDPLHLGRTGIMKLANMFKDAIFRSDVDGRAYSSILTNRTHALNFPALVR